MKSVIPREVETLWTLFTAPTVWALHFLVCYVVMAIYCAKPGFLGLGFNDYRWILGAFTLVSLAFIVFAGYLAWRQWGFGSGDPPHDAPTQHDRRLFQGFATLLLCGLSFVAVFYTSIPLIFLAECQT
jgi:threonine/homoserine/homoserine lactone efflux protein